MNNERLTCGNHVMPSFRSGTPDTAEPLPLIHEQNIDKSSFILQINCKHEKYLFSSSITNSLPFN